MLLWIISFLRGYLVIEARGVFIERFINLCIRRKIYLWDISKKASDISRMKISVRAFKMIRHAAFQSKTRVRIVKRCGLFLVLSRYKKRKAFFIGAAIFVLLICALASFIWSVEISGAEKIDENELRKQLSTCGVSPGVIKYGHSPSDIKEKMLLLNKELSWIWVDIRGTRAFVEVKVRHTPPDMVPINQPCNIVAARDGVINEYIVKTGECVVEKGQVVKRGNLLVSGAVDSSVEGARLFHSAAEVRAITWYEEAGAFPLWEEADIKTGNFLKRRTFFVGDFGINLYKNDKILYSEYKTEIYEKQLGLWGDVVLPFKYRAETFYETVKEKKALTKDEAVKKYGDELYEKIKAEIGHRGQITNKEITYSVGEDNMLYLTVEVECIEDIGKKVPIIKAEENQTP